MRASQTVAADPLRGPLNLGVRPRGLRLERRTITEPFEGRYRPRISHGGEPFYCAFDYKASPAPGVAGVEVELDDEADRESAEWFPHLRRGMRQGWLAARERGQELVGIRVIVRRVSTHPIATTACACERYGRYFIDHLSHRALCPADRADAQRGDPADPPAAGR
jgi:hypothetical protein